MDRKAYHNDLKKRLWDKISLEWDSKWGLFGQTPPSRVSYNFVLQLLNDFRLSKVKDEIGKETLFQFLNNDNPEKLLRITSLEIIAKYVQFDSYKDFVERTTPRDKVDIGINNVQLQTQLRDYEKQYEIRFAEEQRKTGEKISEHIKNNDVSLVEIRTKYNSFKKIVASLLYLGMGLLFLLIMYTFISTSYEERRKKKLKAEIRLAVLEGMGAEFNSYKRLPEIDSNYLKKYFYRNGSAYTKILYLLNTHRIKNRIINNINNPSSFKLFDFNVIQINEDEETATITTTEHWYLRWVNSKTDSTSYIYNQLNRQYYFLRKDDEKWKIEDNFYLSNTVNKEIN
jgi:hypothetical protein